MDSSINTAIQKALELLKAGNKTGAYTILVSILEQDAEVAEAWYLLAFTISDTEQKLDCFRQVLRIDPTNQAAQKQIDKLLAPPPPPKVDAFHPSTFSSTETSAPSPAPAAVPAPVAEPAPYLAPEHPPSQPIPAATRLKKKQAARNPVITWVGIGIAVVLGLILIGLPLIYIANGMDTNRKVDALFADRKCADVAGYKSFSQSFPEFLFSSLYSVYDQVKECQAKIDFDYYVRKQDWPSSYNIIQHYLSDYPNGAFADEMREQAGTVLTSWAKDLVTQNDYKTAIERLELLGRVYPNSSAAPTAQPTILNDYLYWGKYLFEQKDYKGAEKVLKELSSNEKASPEYVKQANLGLASVYVEWGKQDIADGNLDQGLQRYNDAQALAPNLTDYARLKSQASILRVEALVNDGNFNQALAMLDAQLGAVTTDQDKTDLLAEQAKVLDTLAHSDGKEAQTLMNDASVAMCSDQVPTMHIFGTDPSVSRFAFVSHLNLQVPDGWGAFKPAELHYTVCIDHVKTRIQTCGPYTGGHYVYRNRYSWNVKLYDMTTGQLYKTTKFQGSTPRACASREIFYATSAFIEVSGEMPGMQPVLDWLTKLGVHQ